MKICDEFVLDNAENLIEASKYKEQLGIYHKIFENTYRQNGGDNYLFLSKENNWQISNNYSTKNNNKHITSGEKKNPCEFLDIDIPKTLKIKTKTIESSSYCAENITVNHKTEGGNKDSKTEDGNKESKTESGNKETKTESGNKESKTEDLNNESKTESGNKDSKTEDRNKDSKTEGGNKESKTESGNKETKAGSRNKESKTEKKSPQPKHNLCEPKAEKIDGTYTILKNQWNEGRPIYMNGEVLLMSINNTWQFVNHVGCQSGIEHDNFGSVCPYHSFNATQSKSKLHIKITDSESTTDKTNESKTKGTDTSGSNPNKGTQGKEEPSKPDTVITNKTQNGTQNTDSKNNNTVIVTTSKPGNSSSVKEPVAGEPTSTIVLSLLFVTVLIALIAIFVKRFRKNWRLGATGRQLVPDTIVDDDFSNDYTRI